MAKMPELRPSNGIRVKLEGGDEIFRFCCRSVPAPDYEIVYTPDGEDPVTYKVEKVILNVKGLPEIINGGPSPDNLSPYVSYVEVEVSEV